MRLQSLTDERLLSLTHGPHAGPAFGVFYTRFAAAILAFFRRRVPTAELAADLMAETFARALRSRNAYVADRGTAAGWLFGIAKHVLVDSVRRGVVDARARDALRLEPLVFHDHDIDRINAYVDDETLDRALTDLPPDQRAAVIARFIDDRSYAEVAERLRCSELVVRKRVSRGLSRLRLAPKEQR